MNWVDKQRMLISSNEMSTDDDTVSNNHNVNQHHVLTCSKSSVPVSPPIQETANTRTKITILEQTRKIIDQDPSTSDNLVTHNGDSGVNNTDTIKIPNNFNNGKPEPKLNNNTFKEMKQIEQKFKKNEVQLKIKEAILNDSTYEKSRLLDRLFKAETRNMELEMMIKTLNSKVHEPTDSPYGNTLVAQHWRIVGMVGKRLALALQQWSDVGPTYLHQL
jgi:hypothetical protein